MPDGPQRLRLDHALDTADRGGIDLGSTEWSLLSQRLARIASSLDQASTVDIRGETGRSMKGAFTASATGLRQKVEVLVEGQGALNDAASALDRARTARTAMDADPEMQVGSPPTAFQPDPEKTAAENRTDRGLHDGQVTQYWGRHARREAESKRIADQLDQDYARAAERMKKVHGEPDPKTTEHGTGRGGGGRGSAPGGGGGTTYGPRGPGSSGDPVGPSHPTGDGPHDPTGTQGDPTTGADQDPGRADTLDPSTAGDSVTPVGAGTGSTSASLPGGMSPGAAGGMAAGIAGGLGVRGLTNALRGGVATPGQAARSGAAKPIGSTTRSAVSGALGRGGAAPAAGSTARGAAGGRGAAGRAGAPGQSTGQRGGPGAGRGGTAGRGSGGRGAVGVGAGRGRGSKDDERDPSTGDLFDDGHDWVDDEDAATGVLD